MFDELDDLFPLFHRILLFDSSLSILSIGIQKFFPQRIIFRVEFFDFSDDIFCGRRVGVESQSSCELFDFLLTAGYRFTEAVCSILRDPEVIFKIFLNRCV